MCKFNKTISRRNPKKRDLAECPPKPASRTEFAAMIKRHRLWSAVRQNADPLD